MNCHHGQRRWCGRGVRCSSTPPGHQRPKRPYRSIVLGGIATTLATQNQPRGLVLVSIHVTLSAIRPIYYNAHSLTDAGHADCTTSLTSLVGSSHTLHGLTPGFSALETPLPLFPRCQVGTFFSILKSCGEKVVSWMV